MAVEPMKPKFQPTPSRISAPQKFQSSMPGMGHDGAGHQDHQAGGDDLFRAEAG